VKSLNYRLWQVDFSRGLAVVLMVLFNWSFTLSFLKVYTIDGGWLYWWLFPRLIGGSFVFLAGLSVVLSHKKSGSKKIVFRGLKIFLVGMGITALTWIFYPGYTVWFGILHLIGLSVILSVVFLKYKKLILLIGTILLILGITLQSTGFNFSFLIWLGLSPFDLQTFDYWPLLPWFGVFLLGMYFSDLFIKKIRGKNYTHLPIIKQMCFLGRNSLVVYIIHQPVLLTLLYLLGISMF